MFNKVMPKKQRHQPPTRDPYVRRLAGCEFDTGVRGSELNEQRKDAKG